MGTLSGMCIEDKIVFMKGMTNHLSNIGLDPVTAIQVIVEDPELHAMVMEIREHIYAGPRTQFREMKDIIRGAVLKRPRKECL